MAQQPITVLLVGSGGREHALAWRLHRENAAVRIIAAPGNPGIAELAECVSVAATDVDGLLKLARQRAVDWTLVGPEASLAAGIVDAFRAAGQPIFGPTQAAAMLETSKEFSKTLMVDAGVPTAAAVACTTIDQALRAIESLGAPVVVKASGLAAGKGVVVCATSDEARAAATAMLSDGAFGAAGSTILVEEFMEGEELSVFVLTDGENAVLLPPAQDHKRLLDGDRGPNTGGMGAYCPVSLVDEQPELLDRVVDAIVRPTLAAMRDRGTPFTGLLYVGLMVTDDGPRVVEFNCRFGDPETQAVLPALAAEASLSELMFTIARGGELLEEGTLRADTSAVTTVLAARGYPEAPVAGDEIHLAPLSLKALVFHAGTRRDEHATLFTNGGRVLSVTGLGDSIGEATQRSQAVAESIAFTGKQYRTDIASRELARRAGAS